MPVRRFRAEDAAALSAIYRAAVTKLGPRRYSPEQVAAWATFTPSPEEIGEDYGDGRIALVAVDDDDRPLAFADVTADGHLDRFYCAPEAAGTGVAGALYTAIEAAARAAAIDRIFLEASEVAKGFFLARGFTVKHRRDFLAGTVPIHNYAMEKRIGGGEAETAS